MKEFILRRKENKIEGMREFYHFVAENLDTVSVVQIHTLKGFRQVTDAEMTTFRKPKCARYWADNAFFMASSSGEWITSYPYFVPVDFEFKEEK